MKPIEKIIVSLDLTEMDSSLIKYASFVSKRRDLKKIYFVNIIKNLHVPDEIQKEFPGLIENAIEERKKQMKEAVEQNLEVEGDVEIQYFVKKGVPANRILKLINEKNIDLVIIGRKRTLKGTGVLSQRLARRAESSLLIVPEGDEPNVGKLLVPIDFSNNSKRAISMAIDVAARTENKVKIIAQNVYTVPNGYHYSGKSYDEFAEVMQKHAQRDYQKFMKKIDTKNVTIEPVYSLDKNEDPVEDIILKAEEVKADCIVIGTKGRSKSTALFLGSMAERLIAMDNTIPLFVVRMKGKAAAGFMDILKQI